MKANEIISIKIQVKDKYGNQEFFDGELHTDKGLYNRACTWLKQITGSS